MEHPVVEPIQIEVNNRYNTKINPYSIYSTTANVKIKKLPVLDLYFWWILRFGDMKVYWNRKI